MGTLLNLTKEYFGETEREEEKIMERDGKIVFCKDCHNALVQTIDNHVVLYCRLRQAYIIFYENPCSEFH